MDMFIRNLDAFTKALGVEEAPSIFAFAALPWKDDQERDQFIKDITGRDIATENTYGR
jgi:hypothetical protein